MHDLKESMHEHAQMHEHKPLTLLRVYSKQIQVLKTAAAGFLGLTVQPVAPAFAIKQTKAELLQQVDYHQYTPNPHLRLSRRTL